MAQYPTENVRISLRITKEYKLEAIVQVSKDKSYKVKVGGKDWKSGKLLKYQARILEKCRNIIPLIQERIDLAQTFTDALDPNQTKIPLVEKA